MFFLVHCLKKRDVQRRAMAKGWVRVFPGLLGSTGSPQSPPR